MENPRFQFTLPHALQASFVVPTAYAGTLNLTVGFRNFKNESFGRPRKLKVELFYDGKTFISEKMFELWQGLCLMERICF